MARSQLLGFRRGGVGYGGVFLVSNVFCHVQFSGSQQAQKGFVISIKNSIFCFIFRFEESWRMTMTPRVKIRFRQLYKVMKILYKVRI